MKGGIGTQGDGSPVFACEHGRTVPLCLIKIQIDICGYFVYDNIEVINDAGYTFKRYAHQG